MPPVKVAILGSGNIGTDLMIKILRQAPGLEMSAMAGIDPASDGLARANRMGVATTHEGLQGIMQMPVWAEIGVIFDATSAKAHPHHWEMVKDTGKRMVDLTPAAIGPYVVPAVNFEQHLAASNVNMVTCGGQATIPMVAAISQVVPVHYAEIVATIASKSAGPGTRANIDEFTQTTARALEQVGGATRGKAIIILNPAEPPMIMRDTVFTLSENGDREAIADSVSAMVKAVQQYVPGYALHQEVQFEEIPADRPVLIEGLGLCSGLKTTVMLRVEGAGHYLPAYAGNLDIMTSAALATGTRMAELSYS
ncbi:MAG: acetaldehyde dehydrogenase (acetylating) [Bacteroidota bacterium]